MCKYAYMSMCKYMTMCKYMYVHHLCLLYCSLQVEDVVRVTTLGATPHPRTPLEESGPPSTVVGVVPPPPGGTRHGRGDRRSNTLEVTRTVTGGVARRMGRGSGSHPPVQVRVCECTYVRT